MENKKLLLLEDEVEVAELVTEALQGLCEVEVAVNLRTARQLVSLNKYNMIIADRNLPDGDGLSLMEILPDSPNQEIPLLFLSGVTGEDSRVEGLVSGAVDYIEKPFSARELRVRVSKSLH
jgi:DNA-binding response OmpR family regulator